MYINYKMYLLLQFSFNRFETLQDCSTGYEHYVLWCLLDDRIIFEFLAIFLFFEILV